MANLADLGIAVNADVDGVTSAMDDASASVEEFESTTGRVSGFIDQHWQKIAAGAAAGSAALEGFARSQAPLVEAGTRIGASIGESSESMRDLALEASNVTFPLDEVYASMEAGRQQGLESGKQLQEFASFWDVVGDATGESGPALAEAGVALRAVGIAAGDESQALGAFGFIAEETTGSVGDFLTFLERTGPELRGMGADVDDAAAIMGVLESEMGMSGRTARSEFRAAIAESDGTLEGMLDTLGVSTDQFDQYRGMVDESSGVIQRNADIHAESYTPMQRVQHAAQELMHRYSGLTSVAGTMASGLAGVVPVITSVIAAKRLGAIASAQTAAAEVAAGATQKTSILSTAATKIGAVGSMIAAGASYVASMVATAATTVAQWAIMGVQSLIHAAKMAAAWVMAMGPVGWVIATVVALVALIVANWDKVVAFTTQAWDWVTGKVADAWKWITDTTSKAVSSVVGFFVNLKDTAVRQVGELRDRVTSFFGNLRDSVVSTATNLRDRVVSFFTNMRDNAVRQVTALRDGVVGFFTAIRDRAVALVSGLVSSVVGFFTSMVGSVRGAGNTMRQAVVDAFVKLRDGAIDKANSLLAWIKGMPRRLLNNLGNVGTMLTDAGRQILNSLWNGLKDKWEDVKDWVGGLGGKIKDLKGPIETDRKLLVDEGGAIMDGLGKGLVDGWSDNERLLGGMADQIAGAFDVDAAVPNVRVPSVSPMARGGDGVSAGGSLNGARLRLVVNGAEFDAYIEGKQAEHTRFQARQVATMGNG